MNLNVDRPRSQAEMVATVVDVASLLVAAMVVCAVAFDVRFPGRSVVALVFVTWVPGWSVVRIATLPITVLMVVGAFVFSLSLMIITSFLLATRLDWAWAPAAVLWALLCVALLAVVLRRRVDDRVSVS